MKLRTLLLLSPLLALPSRAQSTHVEEARFTSPPGAGIAYHGQSVAWSAGRAVVGDPRASAPGRVYTYTASAGLWNHDATAEAADGAANNRFGWSLALQGDTLAVGARAPATPSGTDRGRPTCSRAPARPGRRCRSSRPRRP